MPARSRPQIKLIFSTDLAGIFDQKLGNFYQIYQSVSAEICPLDGVEFLPFRFNFQKLNNQIKHYHLPIVGLHGSIGWLRPQYKLIDQVFIAIFAALTPSYQTIFKINQQEKPAYLLFHQDEFSSPSFRRQFEVFLKTQDDTLLLIENIYRPHSLADTIKLAKSYQGRIKTGVMIDLVHLLREIMGQTKSLQDYRLALNTTNFDKYWQQMLNLIENTFIQTNQVGLHLPLGENFDSLPSDLLKERHWRDLAKILDRFPKKIKFIVIENQHPQTMLKISQCSLAKLVLDKKQKLAQLVNFGVI